MHLVRSSVPVVLIGVVVTASGAKEQAGQGKQHNAGQEHCSEIEAGEGGIHAGLVLLPTAWRFNAGTAGVQCISVVTSRS